MMQQFTIRQGKPRWRMVPASSIHAGDCVCLDKREGPFFIEEVERSGSTRWVDISILDNPIITQVQLDYEQSVTLTSPYGARFELPGVWPIWKMVHSGAQTFINSALINKDALMSADIATQTNPRPGSISIGNEFDIAKINVEPKKPGWWRRKWIALRSWLVG